MGFSSAWQKLTQGKFSDALSYVMVSEEQLEADRAAEAAHRRLNERNAALGIVTFEQAALSNARLAESNIDRVLTDPNTSPGNEFVETLHEELDGVSGMVQSASTFAVGSVLKVIPWPVWVLLALAAAYYAWQLGLIPLKKRS